MPDITINRHRGNAESVAANERVQPEKSKDRLRILEYLFVFGPRTSKQLTLALEMPYTTVSGRLSELKAMQLIEPTGERREGAAVVRIMAKRIQPEQLKLVV
jgi:DNA-binding transcriptional ArsR family regulator